MEVHTHISKVLWSHAGPDSDSNLGLVKSGPTTPVDAKSGSSPLSLDVSARLRFMCCSQISARRQHRRCRSPVWSRANSSVRTAWLTTAMSSATHTTKPTTAAIISRLPTSFIAAVSRARALTTLPACLGAAVRRTTSVCHPPPATATAQSSTRTPSVTVPATGSLG